MLQSHRVSLVITRAVIRNTYSSHFSCKLANKFLNVSERKELVERNKVSVKEILDKNNYGKIQRPPKLFEPYNFLFLKLLACKIQITVDWGEIYITNESKYFISNN